MDINKIWNTLPKSLQTRYVVANSLYKTDRGLYARNVFGNAELAAIAESRLVESRARLVAVEIEIEAFAKASA